MEKIEGVRIKKLKKITDERGFLMEILRNDDEMFLQFGQVYITAANPGFVKGWHMHENQTDNFTCIKGKIRLVLYDDRNDSKTSGQINEFILDTDSSMIVQIPNKVYHGFESAIDEVSIVLNVPDKHYDYNNPDEIRLPFDTNKINFKWKSTKGG